MFSERNLLQHRAPFGIAKEEGWDYSVLPQRLLCVAMVVSVSPSCVSTAPNMVSSLTVRLLASVLASAVIAAVNSHGFILRHLIYSI